MAKRRARWVVKFLIRKGSDHATFAEGLRYAGLGHFELCDNHNIWFMLDAPRNLDGEVWAEQSSSHFIGLGFNCARVLCP